MFSLGIDCSSFKLSLDAIFVKVAQYEQKETKFVDPSTTLVRFNT